MNEPQQSAMVEQLRDRTKGDGRQATRAGCRTALQTCDWDIERAEKLLRDVPSMATMAPTGRPTQL